MFPELFELPVIHITVKSYGLMMVTGFLLAVLLMRHVSRRAGQNPDHVTNVALYALIAGVIGARIFFVVDNYANFKGDFWSVFAVWQGGLVFLGGVLLAIVVIFVYLLRNKLPLRCYFDILALGLMLGLAFGRIGCFLNGCCFGQPTHLFCAVTFPYGSPPYLTQAKPDPGRGRAEPRLDLPAEYFGYFDGADGSTWSGVSEADKYRAYLKPKELLTDAQKLAVKTKYPAVAIHPTQLYSSADALVLCLILYTFWRKFGNRRPGCTLGLMFMLYGPMRFLLESIREDNPFRNDWWSLNDGWTVSQNLSIYLVAVGLIIFITSLRAKPVTANSRVGS